MRELAEKIAAKQGIKLLLGVNTNLVLRNSAIARGYISLSDIFEYINIQDVDLHMNFSQYKNKLILNAGYKILSRYNQLSHRFYLRSKKVLDTVMFRDITQFSDEMNSRARVRILCPRERRKSPLNCIGVTFLVFCKKRNH